MVWHKEVLGHDFVRLFLQTDHPLPHLMPGQFVQVQIPSSIHGWLRIPISIHFAKPAERQVVLLVQKVGEGSQYIADLKQGERINLVLPLGNGFSIPENITQNTKALLVGGGCGVAPLYFLASMFKEKNIPFHFLTGAKNSGRLLLFDELDALAPTHVCTEDGSEGFQGLVSDHPLWQDSAWSHIYTCGPTPMMKAVAEKAKHLHAFCEVSLENTMACGLGACLCCVTPTADGHNACVCTEGPVFESNVLGW